MHVLHARIQNGKIQWKVKAAKKAPRRRVVPRHGPNRLPQVLPVEAIVFGNLLDEKAGWQAKARSQDYGCRLSQLRPGTTYSAN